MPILLLGFEVCEIVLPITVHDIKRTSTIILTFLTILTDEKNNSLTCHGIVSEC